MIIWGRFELYGSFQQEGHEESFATSGLFTMAFCADEIQATHFESSTCYSFANVDPDYAGYWTKDSMEESLPRLWDSATAGFREALDELILSPDELVAAAGAVALDAYTRKVFGKVMLALMLGCTIKDLYDATAEPINMYERTRRYVKDVTVLFVTVMAEQYLEKVTEKVITKLSDTKFVRGFMDFVMEEDLLTGISDRILLARMYFAESDAEVFGKLSKYLEEDALTYLNAEIGKTGLKPRDVAKTLLKCARKNDDTTLSLDDARFILREMEGGAEESVVVSLFKRGGDTKYYNSDGSPIWPPNRGFAEKPITITLKPGTLVDRYGYDGGSFVSPKGTSYTERALPTGTDKKPYTVFEIVKPVKVQAGEIAPWFGEKGGGIQYEFSQKISDLIEKGILQKVDN